MMRCEREVDKKNKINKINKIKKEKEKKEKRNKNKRIVCDFQIKKGKQGKQRQTIQFHFVQSQHRATSFNGNDDCDCCLCCRKVDFQK